jgi:hypothetical protein
MQTIVAIQLRIKPVYTSNIQALTKNKEGLLILHDMHFPQIRCGQRLPRSERIAGRWDENPVRVLPGFQYR